MTYTYGLTPRMLLSLLKGLTKDSRQHTRGKVYNQYTQVFSLHITGPRGTPKCVSVVPPSSRTSSRQRKLQPQPQLASYGEENERKLEKLSGKAGLFSSHPGVFPSFLSGFPSPAFIFNPECFPGYRNIIPSHPTAFIVKALIVRGER